MVFLIRIGEIRQAVRRSAGITEHRMDVVWSRDPNEPPTVRHIVDSNIRFIVIGRIYFDEWIELPENIEAKKALILAKMKA